jgi:hypothetical protein
VTITNSTITANTAQGGNGGNGGGKGQSGTPGSGVGGGLFNLNGTVTLTNDTLAANTVASGSAGTGLAPYAPQVAADGGAVYNLAFGRSFTGASVTASVTLVNSILSGSVGGNDLVNNRYDDSRTPGGTNTATVNVTVTNLVRSSAALNGTAITGTPVSTADPRLGPLQNNGGPTQTMALLAGSPALDAGTGGVLSTDQRGLPRPGGAHTDLGAFEVQSAGPVAMPSPAPANAPAISLGSTSVVEGTRHFTLTVTGTNVTFTPASVVLVDGVALQTRWVDGSHLEVQDLFERLEHLRFSRARHARHARHAPRHREGFDEAPLSVAVFTPGVGVSPSQTLRVLEGVAPGEAGTPRERLAAERFEAQTGHEADRSPAFQVLLRFLRSHT